MATATGMVEVERQGETLVLTVRGNLGELGYEAIEEELSEALLPFEDDWSLRNVVMDFDKASYFGTTPLGVFLRLWEPVRHRYGSLSFCKLSPFDEYLLEATGLAETWPAYSSREEALDAVGR
jgi:anti-anti-sigma factor